MMVNRVVITGMGVVAPNGVGIENFNNAIMNGTSGISFIPEMSELGMNCHVGGIPSIPDSYIQNLLPDYMVHRIESSTLMFGMLAGLEAYNSAGLKPNENVDWDAGVIMGTQSSDGGLTKSIITNLFNKKDIRKISGRTAEQVISSSVSSYLSGYLGLGNCSLTNSSACSTGTEAILTAYQRIKEGKANLMLAGSSEGGNPFTWSVLDRIRALTSSSNNNPPAASKPMNEFAGGLVPSCGSAAVVLETLDSAMERGAKIYAEIIGGSNNCGAQRNGGTMTKPNSEGIIKCIKAAVKNASINEREIDIISGHLTGTYADSLEVESWSKALGISGDEFPYINSLKSMTGHCLAAAGSIETVASILQIWGNYIHPSINCEHTHPEILKFINPNKIPSTMVKKNVSCVIKANFGFGDLNTCLVFKKFV